MKDNAPQKDHDSVSVFVWMMLQLFMLIPVVNVILVIVLAFCGKNRTQRNYYWATIVWFLIITVILFVIGATIGVNLKNLYELLRWGGEGFKI